MKLFRSATLALLLATACTKGGENKASNYINASADGTPAAGAMVYYGYDKSSAVAYKPFNPAVCATVSCPVPQDPPFDAEIWKGACESQGYKMVEITCCSPSYCTGLPVEPEENVPPGTVKTEEKEPHPEMLGKPVYFGYDAKDAIPYEGYNAESCANVDCIAPDEPTFDFDEFGQQCAAQKFEMILVGCCSYSRCTGLPVKP